MISNEMISCLNDSFVNVCELIFIRNSFKFCSTNVVFGGYIQLYTTYVDLMTFTAIKVSIVNCLCKKLIFYDLNCNLISL